MYIYLKICICHTIKFALLPMKVFLYKILISMSYPDSKKSSPRNNLRVQVMRMVARLRCVSARTSRLVDTLTHRYTHTDTPAHTHTHMRMYIHTRAHTQ